jgi:hypothetical protein
MDLEFSLFMSPDETVALIESTLPDIAAIEWVRATDTVREWTPRALPTALIPALATPYPVEPGTSSQLGHQVGLIITNGNPAGKSAEAPHPSQCLYWSFGGIDVGVLYLSTMSMRSHLDVVVDYGHNLRKRLRAASGKGVLKESGNGWVQTSLRITEGAERMVRSGFELRQRLVGDLRYRV